MHTQPFTYQQLQQLLAQAETLPLSARARERLQWYAYYVEHGRSVTSTCLHFNIHRATFQRWLTRLDPSNPQSLEERSHVPQVLGQSPVPADIVAIIRQYRQDQPRLGKERIAALLQHEHRRTFSASTVGRVIERECLYFGETPHHWKKRVQAERDLAEKASGQPLPLTLQQTPVVEAQSPPTRRDDRRLCRPRRTPWWPLRRPWRLASVLEHVEAVLVHLRNSLWTENSARKHAKPAMGNKAPALSTSSLLSSRPDGR